MKPKTGSPFEGQRRDLTKTEAKALLAEHAVWLEKGQRFEADFSKAPIAKWYRKRYGGQG